jgi:hypothetical protein
MRALFFLGGRHPMTEYSEDIIKVYPFQPSAGGYFSSTHRVGRDLIRPVPWSEISPGLPLLPLPSLSVYSTKNLLLGTLSYHPCRMLPLTLPLHFSLFMLKDKRKTRKKKIKVSSP